MVAPNDLVQKFIEVKAGNLEAIDYFLNYFMPNVEKQIKNLTDLSEEEIRLRINRCLAIVIDNLYVCFDYTVFFEKTMKDIRNIIYLNQVNEIGSSKVIMSAQRDLIDANLVASNLSSIDIPVKYQELARLYYIENKSIPELSEIFKCTNAIIYFRLRKIAEALLAKKASSYVSDSESFIYKP